MPMLTDFGFTPEQKMMRESLLRLARKAVHQLGPQVSIQEIANHAKTSKPVYYRYFGDKEGLRQALGAMVITDFRQRVIAAGLAKQDEASALHAMVTAYLELAANSPNLYFFVTAVPRDATAGTPAAGDDDASGALNDFFEEITSLIAQRLTSLPAAAVR